MSFQLRGAVAIFWLLAMGQALHAQGRKLARYHDPKYGVTFAYPAKWSADHDMVFYLATSILEPVNAGSDYSQALMKVGFGNTGAGPYAGTIMDGVEFVYFVAPEATQAACYNRIKEFQDTSEGDPKPSTVVIGGVSYLHLTTGEGGLGHFVDRDLYAAYAANRCYLFEGDIHTMTLCDGKPLTPAQRTALRAQLTRVMQSVRISVR